ncbi:unnamed protein product [Bemisia tabaci]|uniref:SAM domain-containing protein n=1 Tax=Bemisia tabaci TaxID=7038 RepID=A0A9P0C9Q0_BEMTA|nr:PREDICTED: Usher syndrome type-1G protein homolog [Bemisia tabaci]CAH0774182.1 unnamed protein product [Bemisia tabaci]
MSTRYHKAAQDGNLDVLRETTKRDCNAKDEDGMTPTLWAAFEGNLEALRLLVGRGGNVEKANYHFGQTALHIAAARGHMNCVSFLVGFDANLWALDHDMHTPMEVAAMNGRKEILDYLDKTAAKQEMTNKKKVDAKKEKALKDAERRRKKYEERMKKEREKEKKQIKKVEKELLGGNKIDNETPIPTLPLSVRRTVSDTTSSQSFTQLVGGGASNGTMSKKPANAVVGVKKILDRKLRNGSQSKNGSDFKVREVEEDGTKSTRSLTGQMRDSQIIYVNSYDNKMEAGKRGRLTNVFELQRSVSQPDYLNNIKTNGNENNHFHDQGSMFDRPGFGSVAFRKSITATLNAIPRSDTEIENSSIGSAGSLAKRNQQHSSNSENILLWGQEDLNISDEENVSSNDSSQWFPLQRFLVATGVSEYTPKFIEQRIDLEALLMLSDEDLITLGIPMGPRRKLLNAVLERKKALEKPGDILDSKL